MPKIFTAREIKKIKNPDQDGLKTWDSLKVGVFEIDGETELQVGTYIRNHPSLLHTFEYFRKNGQDYALYSPHYLSIRVMALPSCEDIGGLTPDRDFVPVDYFVPWEDERDENAALNLVADFGFVAGVIWGGPYISPHICYLDLTRVEEGIIDFDRRFGYIEMPVSSTLEQAIFIDEDTFDAAPYAYIGVQKAFDVTTGKMIE